MSDTGIFCTTDEVLRKAGADVSSVITAASYAYINDFVTQAESTINVESGYNWSDDYASLNADVKGILKLAASNLAAMFCINYDLASYPLRIIAETMLDVLRDGYQQAIKVLKDEVTQDFIGRET